MAFSTCRARGAHDGGRAPRDPLMPHRWAFHASATPNAIETRSKFRCRVDGAPPLPIRKNSFYSGFKISGLPPSLPLMSPFGLPSAGYPASTRWHVFRFASLTPAHVALQAAFGRQCWFASPRHISPFGLLMQPTAQPPCYFPRGFDCQKL